MNWPELETWHYGVIIGGLVLLVCAGLYFLPARKFKVPGAVTAAFAGLAVGLAVGIIWLAGFGYKPVGGAMADNGGGPKGGGADQKGGFGGAPKGGPRGGDNPPSPRAQLLTLINTLDTVVDRPVAVNLTAADRAAVAEQLRGLDTAEEVKDADATARLEAILKVVEKDRKALETVGYRWPGPAAKGGGGNTGPPPAAALTTPNPFRPPATAQKIQSLRERLEKK
jgi:hypothetical protein